LRGKSIFIAPNSLAKIDKDLRASRQRKIEAMAIKGLKGPTLGVPIIR